MKNVLLICLLFVVQSSLYGQKQESGNITLEMELSPLGSEPLKISSIKARYFFNDQFSFRLGTFIGGNRNPSVMKSGEIELESVNSTFDLILRPGIEKHFQGTEKLSPYVGSELYLGMAYSNQSSESLFGANEVMTTINKSRTGSFGINLLTGADFYFTPKVYIGLEMGFGFLRDGKGKNVTEYENPDDPSKANTSEKGNSTQFNWGPNYQGTFRIGYHLK
ncbi:hypothetical protein OAD28_07075 [Flavobacteriales bacterium]|nr:hypothetical protein [Flavobacteriales bacterium]